MRRIRPFVLLVAALALSNAALAQDSGSRVTVYTSIDPARLKPVLQDFAKSDFGKDAQGKEAGVAVVLETGEPDILLGRLMSEGPATAADLILLPNAARFDRAATAGLLRPLALADLERAVPPPYRDPGARWFGLASFGRAIVYATARVKPTEVTGYEDLGKPQWKGRLCLPSVSRPSNRALFATMLHRLGPEGAEAWAKALAANVATLPDNLAGQPTNSSPETADSLLIQAIAGGFCDVAIVGSRALSRLGERGDDRDRAALDRIGVVWPSQEGKGEAGRGVQIDIVGVGVTAAGAAGGAVREPVLKFLAYLATDTGQRLLAEALWAFPIKPGVPLSNSVTRWGPFRADPTPLATVLPLLVEAGRIADESGWP